MQRLGYQYDQNGNITNITNSKAEESIAYAYDDLNRLTTVTGSETGTYGYDDYGRLANMNGTSLTYGDASHIHAVTASSAGNQYVYNANGDATTRVADGDTWTISMNGDGRLIQMSNTDGDLLKYRYNADGAQGYANDNGDVTIYIGSHFEVRIKAGAEVTPPPWLPTLSTLTQQVFMPLLLSSAATNVDPVIPDITWVSYYHAGASKLAMRVQSEILPPEGETFYLLADHLGSTHVTTNDLGLTVGETTYSAFGSSRNSTGDMITDYGYTGQRKTSSGLYYYNARWYDPAIGHFVQADTVFDGFDRYAYVRNNPLKYNDPTGNSGSPFDVRQDGDEQVGRKATKRNSYSLFACGMGTNSCCSTNTAVEGYGGVPMHLFRDSAIKNGYAVSNFDSNNHGDNRLEYATAIKAQIDQNKSGNYVIFGHSLGGDAAILAAYMAINDAGFTGTLTLVLLDPYLYAEAYYNNLNFEQMLRELKDNGVEVLFYDDTEDGDKSDEFNSMPDTSEGHKKMTYYDPIHNDVKNKLGWK